VTRICRAVLVLSVLAQAAAAQGSGSKFVALTGGASLSDMSGFSLTGDSRWGGTAGLLIGVNTWRTAATLEGTWIQKGGGDTRLDYIEFPLTLGAVAVMGGGEMRGRLYSGISLGFKVGCSSNVLSCDDANGTEWGWPIGIQLARVTEKGTFFGIDVRYTVALSDAFEFTDVINRPWVFRLMVGKQLGAPSHY